jgi:hypothetical protein
MSDYNDCKWCGKSFKWKYAGHDYCSEKCKFDHQESKQKKPRNKTKLDITENSKSDSDLVTYNEKFKLAIKLIILVAIILVIKYLIFGNLEIDPFK